MKTTTTLRGIACAFGLAAIVATAPASAQDLVITNARILDGAGGEIANGTIVIDDGVILAVSSGGAAVDGETVIDAEGRTITPGYIDAHRHLGQPTPESMQGWIDAGFTGVLEALTFNLPAYTAARDQIEAGEMVGPRLVFSAMVPVNQAPMGGGGGDAARTDGARPEFAPTEAAPPMPVEQARAMVRQAAEQGADNIKTIVVATPGGSEAEVLAAITEEAHANGLRSVSHATSVANTLILAEAGVDLFVHTPHIGWVDEDGALETIVAADAPMVSTLGVFTPYYGEEGDGVFRDFESFPWNTLHSAGQGPVNLKLLANAGVTVAYGTDTSFSPRESLRHELRALSSVFSPAEMLTMLTKNAAIAADLDDITGTLEPGKAADIVMVDGDPLTDIFDLLNVELVVKDGVVVSDQR